jgi:hypothetical protein
VEQIFNYNYRIELNHTDITAYIKEFELTEEIEKLYSVFTFKIFDFEMNLNYARDGIERIKLVLNSNTFNFLIDSIERDTKNSYYLICKSKGVLLEESYSGKLTAIEPDSYPIAIRDIFLEYSIITESAIPIIPLLNNVDINLSRSAFIADYLQLIGYECYTVDQKVVFKAVEKVEAPADIILDDVIDANVYSNSTTKIGKVYINQAAEESITAEPRILAEIDPSPQPLSPLQEIIYRDDLSDKTYIIPPISSTMKVFYTPLITTDRQPTINGVDSEMIEDYYVVEKFLLDETSILETKGAIKEIVKVEYNQYYHIESKGEAKLEIRREGEEETIVIYSDLQSNDLSKGNNIKIRFLETDSYYIGSSISGEGTEENPYHYDLVLGDAVNIPTKYPKVFFDLEMNDTTHQASLTVFNSSVTSINILSDWQQTTETDPITESSFIDGALTIYVQVGGFTNPSAVIGGAITDQLATLGLHGEFDGMAWDNKIPATGLGGYIRLFSRPEFYNFQGFTPYEPEQYFGRNDNKAICEFINNDPNARGIIRANTCISKKTPQQIGFDRTSLYGGFGGNSINLLEGVNFEVFRDYNKINFFQKISGFIKIAYKTNITRTIIPPQEREGIVSINITYLDQVLKHRHEAKADNYFPRYYIINLELAKEFLMPLESVINLEIELRNTDDEVIEVFQGDEFGELQLTLADYGIYKLKPKYKSKELHIIFYANKLELTLNEIEEDTEVIYTTSDTKKVTSTYQSIQDGVAF